MGNFNCEKIITSTPYLISEYSKIISMHKKKLTDVQTRGTNINSPEEKIA